MSPVRSRVLVVDDAGFVRTMIHDILDRAGLDVVGEAANGADAVDRCRELAPDLVILDIIMPELDGLEAASRIKKELPDTRIVFCSALGSKETVLNAIRAGGADFVVKPFSSDRLVDAVKRSLITNRVQASEGRP